MFTRAEDDPVHSTSVSLIIIIILLLLGVHFLGSTPSSVNTCWKDVPGDMSLSEDTACCKILK